MRAHLVIMVFAIAPAASSLGRELHVPAEYPTIQAAIDASNDGDTVFVAPGIYRGDGNRDISLWGKIITVKSTDGPAVTIIDSEGTPEEIHRGFYLAHGDSIEAVIEGFTITGGYVVGDSGGIGPDGGGGGGGILINGSSITIRNCIIHNNVSATLGIPFLRDGRAGGIYMGKCEQVDIERCIISENVSEKRGGGLMVVSGETRCTIQDSLIWKNTCEPPFEAAGAWLVGHSEVINCTIVNNHSGGFTGGLSVTGEQTIRNTIIWGNTAANGVPQISIGSILPPTMFAIHNSIVQGGKAEANISEIAIVEWGDTNMLDDPMFVQPNTGDYRLEPSSPGIDAASYQHPSESSLDLAGDKRVQNCRADIGAYESPYFVDCDDNDLPDACQANKGITPDCNMNGIPDGCEFAEGTVEDCNENRVPDECDPDTDEDGLIDDCDNCELFNPDQADCQPNGAGDVCDLAETASMDCNENGVPDECDIATGGSFDEWPPAGDGIPDDCQFDCNANLIPDLDDIATGFSRDSDENTVPDECECPIHTSVPFSGIIDARQPNDIRGLPDGWTTIQLDMCADAGEIILADQFEVSASNGRVAPGITEVVADKDQITLSFDGPIPPGAMTTIHHVPSNTHVCLGFLPGDAGGNRKTSELDILQLIDRLNGVLPQTPRLCDIDRSGECDPLDILRLIDLLNGAGEDEPWLDVDISPCR